MKKYLNKKFILFFLIYTAVVKLSTVIAWETIVEEPLLNWWESEPIIIEAPEFVIERTRLEELRLTHEAIEVGEACRVDHAKQMRLNEIAEEAKEIQSSLK